ncbi:MAG: hypothetical protein J5822_02615 [Eubacteriaceae bacterium]|nr:hypothetical protein [Eubacteriaceae bacterium]
MTVVNKRKTPFQESELTVIGGKSGLFPTSPKTPIFNTPISIRENALSVFKDKKPMFAVTTNDFTNINIPQFNNHLARGRDADDVFGIHWTFVPEVGGSISHGGNPKFEDANDWKDAITMPNVDEWDWAGDVETVGIPDTRFALNTTFVNGFGFERLISLMDFMNAAIAVADEDQYDAMYDLVGQLYDVGIACCKKIFELYPFIDGITFHDDWGSQKAPFFSDEVARTIFLPHMKRFCDFIHANGRYTEIHSCGHTESRVDVFIEAGIDTWQMQILNDFDMLYKTVGDKMVIQIPVDELPFDFTDDEQARAGARYYVDHYCLPGKPSIVSGRGACQSMAFMKELYEYSRKHYLAQD